MEPMTRRKAPIGMAVLLSAMTMFVLLGAPLVFYLWHALNDLLAARLVPHRLFVALPVLLLFAGWLAVMAAFVRKLEVRDAE
jgi:hypothetical protein